MTTSRALDQFLSSVEKRAFKIAQLGLRNDDDALDAVQDAMMKLVQSYASRADEEWRPLFYRILANGIRDMQRRRTVRGRIMAWLPVRDAEDDEEFDPDRRRRRVPMPAPRSVSSSTRRSACSRQRVAELPPRQQQAFLLRNFEGLDVNETASAMGCSEGSVKTHYFRALESLRAKLGEVILKGDAMTDPTNFEKRTQEVLEESTARLDGRTRSRLTQARHAALGAARASGAALVAHVRARRRGRGGCGARGGDLVGAGGRPSRSRGTTRSKTWRLLADADAPDFVGGRRRSRVLRMGRG